MSTRVLGMAVGICLLGSGIASAAPQESQKPEEAHSGEGPRLVADSAETERDYLRGVEGTGNDAEGLIQIRFTATAGRLASADVFRGMARALRLDETAFDAHRPRGSIDLDGRSARAALVVANLAVPGVSLERIPGSEGEEPQLLVTIDRDRLRARWRQGKALVRRSVTGSNDGTSAKYGLAVDETWTTTPDDITRVVLLHGYNASALSIDPLAEELRRLGHSCAVATYPNDQSIDQSARWLSDELSDLFESDEPKRIAFVTNSMGGLIARRMLEDPRLDPGRIDRLIMIAPPNHGSNLARIAFGLDVWEHFLRSSGLALEARFYRSIDDGLGEAARDLRPDSPFLTALNGRDRNPRVAYTIILGNRGRLSDAQRRQLRESLEALAQRSETVKLVAPRIDAALADFDEIVEGQGDGVVSLRRGRLAGVDDVHVLSFRHDIVGHLSGDAGVELVEIIAERLRQHLATDQ